MRPCLCSAASTRALLAALWPSRAAAFRRLGKTGLPKAVLDRLARCAAPPADPYLAGWHDGVPAAPTLPRMFVERILPSLDGAPWSNVRRAAALHERLNVADDTALSGLVARLFQTAPQHALAWLELLESQPPERRSLFLVLALETRAVDVHPALPPALLADLASAPAEMYACWTYAVLDGIHRSANPRYLAAGVHIARNYAPDSTLSRVLDAPDFDDDTLARLEHLLPDDWGGHELVSLWETCAVVPGFSSYLKRAVWDSLRAEQRRCLLRFFMAMRWDQDGPMAPRRWRAIAPQIPRLERQLQEVPAAFTDQYLSDLGSVLSGTRVPSKVAERLPLAIDHLARINRPPFNPDGNIEDSVANLLTLPELLRRHVLAAPTEVWLALDKACRRSNAGSLIAWGLSSLVAVLPQLVHDAFGTATGTLTRVARQLGVLSWAARMQLLSRCAQEPIFAPSVEERSLDKTVAMIDGIQAAEAAAVVPRAVREHLGGRRPLSPGQIERHLKRIRAALPICRLAVVRAAVDEQLARSVGAPRANREALDALAMLQDAYKNKRGLRKFLRAYLNGDADHLLRHPITRGWLRRHPQINVDLWTGGFERRISRTAGGDVIIRIEQDPLEVLKMGTYVGSCLSLGGSFSYSAAAVLLDINKQVLYARDQRGAVIARQLLAISKDDRLVAYAVYPESTAPWLQRAFDAFDTEFAAMLGIERAAPGEEYYIEDVLSHDWWDDGTWDPSEVRAGVSRGHRASRR